MGTIEPQYTTNQRLSRIAWLSARDPHKSFTSLMHHFNVESLKECFDGLDRKKAVGVDGIDKEQYRLDLGRNLEELVTRMKRMAYRPGPVRQVMIPKEGKPGAVRPLGISNFEDKIIQKMMQKVLENIYDPTFLDCSYGFRRGIGPHDAIRDLHQHLYKNEVQTVIDLDLENYFGSIDQKTLQALLTERIKDGKFMRYIIRMFKAGVLSEGELQVSEEGVVQGSTSSPILANIFAHYVIDEWIEREVKPRCKGTVRTFRFADDCVLCCQYDSDAVRVKAALAKRLAKYKLKMNEGKTKMVNFRKTNGIKTSFDFLGFTFYLGRSRVGRIIPKLKTIGKRFRAKLKKVNEWARSIRNKLPLREIWYLFCSKLRGHINYYGVSFNEKAVRDFMHQAEKIMFKWLNKRSQRKSFNWQDFQKYTERHPLPAIKVYHKLF